VLSLRRTYFWIFASLVAETACGPLLRPPLLFPHVGLLVVVYAAVEDGALTGLRAGLWLGLLLDLMSLERFGTYFLLYGAAGFACGLLRGKVFVESFVSQWLIPAAAYAGVLAVVAMLGRSEPEDPVWPLFEGLIRNSAIFTTVFVSPFVFRWCAAHLMKKRVVHAPGFLP